MAKKTSERKEGAQPGNTNAEKWTEKKAMALGQKLIKWMLAKDKQEYLDNIFYKDFLIQNDLYSDVIGYLAKKFPSFSDLIKKAVEIQELKLIKLGVQGKLAQTMVIFVLKNNHQYIDESVIRKRREGNLEEMTADELNAKIDDLLVDINEQTKQTKTE